MKKKLLAILLSLFSLCSCGTNPNCPPVIKDFVNDINFKWTLDNLKGGSFHSNYVEKINDVESGKNSINFTFSRDQNNYNFEAIYTFEGNQIKDEITNKTVKLNFIGLDEYNFEVTTNKSSKTEKINGELAYSYYYKIFDSNKNSYRVGGLYYGDFVAINLNKFYHLYSLSEDGQILIVEEKKAQYVDTLWLDQKFTIDKNGMLLTKKEFAYSDDSKNTGLLEESASYIYG